MRSGRLGAGSSLRLTAGMAILGIVSGCGVPGAPIPPEDVGVAKTIERQTLQEQEGEGKTDGGSVPEGQPGDEVILPPLRPVGTR